MNDVFGLCKEWLELYYAKASYAFGDDTIDIEMFKDLVKRTYFEIRDMHSRISKNDYSEISPEYMRDYIDLISEISLYGAPLYIDESENQLFTVSRLIAFDLADLGGNYGLYFEDEDEPFEEGVILSHEAYSYEMYDIKYNVDSGDLSDYIRFANAVEN